jgi:spermidine synthase
MTSGMYKYAGSYEAQDAAGLRERVEKKSELLFYEDGLTATITVLRNKEDDQLFITTNGKVDGSSGFDMPTQRLAAHLPLLLHQDPKRMTIVGLGTGCSLGSASLYPLEELSCLEIEQAMVDGAQLFAEHNQGVLDDPQEYVRVTDGRLFLQLHPDEFDVIVSEPSNPWLAGVSHLFTQEYYEIGARALREGGIFAQWVQLYGLRPEMLRTVMRTFGAEFSHVYVFSTLRNSDLLMLGSQEPLDFDLSRLETRLKDPAIADDLRDKRVSVRSALELVSRLRMGPDGFRAFVGEGRLHRDDLPLISYEAPRDLYRDTATQNLQEIARHARGVAPLLTGLPEDTDELIRVWVTLAAYYRRFLRDPGPEEREAERRLLSDTPVDAPLSLDPIAASKLSKDGIALAQQGDLPGAIDTFQRAHQLDPSHAGAAGNLSRALRDAGKPGEALSAAEWAVAVDPRYAFGYWHRARAHLSLGHHEKALADFERTLKLDPTQTRVLVEVARLKQELGDLDGARTSLDRYLQAHPDDEQAQALRKSLDG